MIKHSEYRRVPETAAALCGGPCVRRWLGSFYDLFDAVFAEFDGDADEEIRNAVFAFEEDCTGQ